MSSLSMFLDVFLLLSQFSKWDQQTNMIPITSAPAISTSATAVLDDLRAMPLPAKRLYQLWLADIGSQNVEIWRQQEL